MGLSKFEKVIIILVLIVGFIGGVILVFCHAPAIISSIFIAMGIATLVYHFLGGIANAQVNTGIVKLGGSMAALIGSAILINNLLIEQMNNPDEELMINSRNEVVNCRNKVLGKISFNSFLLKPNKGLILTVKDTICLGKLSLADLGLSDQFEITENDSVKLGKLSRKDLSNIGLLNKLELNNYTEIKYNLRLESPLLYEVDRMLWTDVNQYEVNYQDLHFTVEPYEVEENNFKTRIKFRDKNLPEYFSPIRRDQTILLTDLYKTESLIYLVRVRQLVKSNEWSTYNNFVQYQIIEFSGKLTSAEL